MGNINSINNYNTITFENLHDYVKNKNSNIILLNTLNKNNQQHNIVNTIKIETEEATINNLIKSDNKDIRIYIYGKNCYDITVFNKYNQLKKLGFNNIYIYLGGLFEWLLLQDIYGNESFPIIENNNTINFLLYKPNKTCH
jgi:23S rRNA pseudoU1915 N3-methylase RlmH